MAVPKKRTSVARKGLRRGGHTHKLFFAMPGQCTNPDCAAIVASHCVCPKCGHYKGNKIFDIKVPKVDAEGAEGAGGTNTPEVDTALGQPAGA